jgi:hypothetical protein
MQQGVDAVSFRQRRRKDVGGGDRVLNGEIDANSTNG